MSQRDNLVLVEVGAFHEVGPLALLFYGAVVDELRTAARETWLQIESENSWWGRRKADLRLAPKPPIGQAKHYLGFDLQTRAKVDAFVEGFWYRSPLRFYGWQDLPLSEKLAKLADFYRSEALWDFRPFFPEVLRFAAEKDRWGQFLRILVLPQDVPPVETILREKGVILTAPLVMDRSGFA